MKGQTLEKQKIMCGAKMGNQTLEEYKKTMWVLKSQTLSFFITLFLFH
jgi:hypothetical protein